MKKIIVSVLLPNLGNQWSTSPGSDAFCVAFEDGGYCLKNEWRRFNLRTDVDAKVIGTVFDEVEP